MNVMRIFEMSFNSNSLLQKLIDGKKLIMLKLSFSSRAETIKGQIGQICFKLQMKTLVLNVSK
jgi:hypothetical protein